MSYRQGRNTEVLSNNNGFLGINLGSDYCAEHEWGIRDIHRLFGIDKQKSGLDKRLVTRIPKELIWVETKKYSGFTTEEGNTYGVRDFSRVGDLLTAWSESGFCVLSSDVKTIAKLKELFEAFQKKDVAIWLGGGGLFQNAGLALAIASRLPHHVTTAWLENDIAQEKLTADVKATGIEDLLEKAGRRYFALSPSRGPDGSLHFWLNPMEQHKYEAQWCTLEDLKLWAENKGPVLKKRR